MKIRLLSALLCAAVLCGCSNAAESMTDEEMKAELGLSDSKAPSTQLQNTSGFPDLHSFSATTLEGATITEKEFARADVTVINIWATTCPPCIQEMPELEEFRASLPDNVALMTWCLDGAFYEDTVRAILNDADFSGITIIAGDGDLNSFASSLMYTPTTVFVDSEGNLLGDAIIGAGNIKRGYTARINEALRSMGKEEIS